MSLLSVQPTLSVSFNNSTILQNGYKMFEFGEPLSDIRKGRHFLPLSRVFLHGFMEAHDNIHGKMYAVVLYVSFHPM